MRLNLQSRSVQWAVIALAVIAAILLNYRDQLAPISQQPSPAADHQANDLPFDFYVLALSWSPAFCASEAGQRSQEQCGSNADFGFVTHGLWPQFEQGWPSFCQSPHGDRMPRDIARTLLDIMPDHGLIQHQWDKHGTCSGLDPLAYAGRIRQATDRITIPTLFEHQTPASMDASQIERAFQQANPAIPSDAIAVACPSNRFTEVRICLNQALSPRPCQEVDRNGCARPGLTITRR
jgi:ribonuclease T2